MGTLIPRRQFPGKDPRAGRAFFPAHGPATLGIRSALWRSADATVAIGVVPGRITLIAAPRASSCCSAGRRLQMFSNDVAYIVTFPEGCPVSEPGRRSASPGCASGRSPRWNSTRSAGRCACGSRVDKGSTCRGKRRGHDHPRPAERRHRDRSFCPGSTATDNRCPPRGRMAARLDDPGCPATHPAEA